MSCCEEKPCVSVIVPVYKVEKFLERCILSILNQSFMSFELILVDDGSPDSCPEICDRFRSMDTRIKVIHQDNSGVSSARNKGLDLACADYLMFVDSDDYLDHCAIESAYTRIKCDNSDIVVFDYSAIDSQENEINIGKTLYKLADARITQTEFLGLLQTPIGGFFVPVWNKIYRKDVFDSLRFPNNLRYEDEFIIHHVVSRCNNISLLGEKLYYYQIHQDSFMARENMINQVDYGYALINRFFLAKEQDWREWRDNTVESLSYNMEKWYKGSEKDKELRKKYLKIRKNTLFLLFDSCAWRYYNWKGRLYHRLELLFSPLLFILKGYIERYGKNP